MIKRFQCVRRRLQEWTPSYLAFGCAGSVSVWQTANDRFRFWFGFTNDEKQVSVLVSVLLKTDFGF